MDTQPTRTERFTQVCLIAGTLFGMLVMGAILAMASDNGVVLATYLALCPFLGWGGWVALNLLTPHWMLRPLRERARALAGAQVTVDAVPRAVPDRAALFEDAEALRDEYEGSLKPRVVAGGPRPQSFDSWLRQEKQRQHEQDARLAWYRLEVSVRPAPEQQQAAWSPRRLSLVCPAAELTGRSALFGQPASWELEDLAVWDAESKSFRAPEGVDVYGAQRLQCLAGIPPDRRTLRLVYATVLPLADVEFPPHDAHAAAPLVDADAAQPPAKGIADAAAERSPLQFNMLTILLLMAIPGVLAFLLRLGGLDGVPLTMTTLLTSLAAALCVVFWKALG